MGKAGVWKGGVWYPAKNPEGFNQHKKDTRITIGKTEDEKKSEAKALYIEIWKARNELKSKVQRYAFLTREIIGIKEDDLK